MIAPGLERAALGALNGVLVVLRQLAHEDVPAAELAVFLDMAEYLPRLLADDEDRTAAFRDTLVDLTRRRPEFQLAIERFDHPAARW